jgi:hypothetical protein
MAPSPAPIATVLATPPANITLQGSVQVAYVPITQDPADFPFNQVGDRYLWVTDVTTAMPPQSFVHSVELWLSTTGQAGLDFQFGMSSTHYTYAVSTSGGDEQVILGMTYQDLGGTCFLDVTDPAGVNATLRLAMFIVRYQSYAATPPKDPGSPDFDPSIPAGTGGLGNSAFRQNPPQWVHVWDNPYRMATQALCAMGLSLYVLANNADNSATEIWQVDPNTGDAVLWASPPAYAVGIASWQGRLYVLVQTPETSPWLADWNQQNATVFLVAYDGATKAEVDHIPVGALGRLGATKPNIVDVVTSYLKIDAGGMAYFGTEFWGQAYRVDLSNHRVQLVKDVPEPGHARGQYEFAAGATISADGSCLMPFQTDEGGSWGDMPGYPVGAFLRCSPTGTMQVVGTFDVYYSSTAGGFSGSPTRTPRATATDYYTGTDYAFTLFQYPNDPSEDYFFAVQHYMITTVPSLAPVSPGIIDHPFQWSPVSSGPTYSHDMIIAGGTAYVCVDRAVWKYGLSAPPPLRQFRRDDHYNQDREATVNHASSMQDSVRQYGPNGYA